MTFPFFKPKPSVATVEPTHEFVVTEELIDIGQAIVEVTLKDGRKFHTMVYGSVNQTYDVSSVSQYRTSPQHNGPYHFPFVINDSECEAVRFLRYLNAHTRTFVDDPEDPQVSWVGEAIHAEILHYESYKKSFKISSLVEIAKDGQK